MKNKLYCVAVPTNAIKQIGCDLCFTPADDGFRHSRVCMPFISNMTKATTIKIKIMNSFGSLDISKSRENIKIAKGVACTNTSLRWNTSAFHP